ncbi:MAG: hypothetical protein K0Q72_4273 [Armatimonadetes bacterium]|jgi:hypothetical protein|nr:hypothetical protein [Armatimonadota bacterium]
MRRPGSPISPAGWLGLAWVYSGAFWLWLTWAGGNAGAGELIVLAFLRAAATVAVGVAICGTEKWGWATGLVLSSFHAFAGWGVLALGLWALSARPAGSLSWQPVLLGMTSAETTRLVSAAGLVAAASTAGMALLWREQAQFDVVRGRAYGSVVQNGLAPALLVILVDYLLWIGWSGVR